MVALIVVTFFFAWTPYAVLCLWAVFADTKSVPHLLAMVPPLFAKTASTINPFIYFLSNPCIRADVLQLLGCRARSSPHMAISSDAVEEERCCQDQA
ncbi:G-protein coupled receptor, putative [Ixodes scapularis]|uniref:G-protein coupled receptor, putative n=1 Tax=Ixodes scapularis TaxID=6945 RepID=B7PMQ8_IXOSC|nr:G-protein coupled receptor, putative [Ixodes scapularis]|eukprot:XP_002435056.1 G-protein coupled receptor, putative [Ixodes scapularis]